MAGSIVRGLISQGLALNSVTADLNLEGHNVTGGASLNEVKRMLKILKKWTLSAESKLLKRKI